MSPFTISISETGRVRVAFVLCNTRRRLCVGRLLIYIVFCKLFVRSKKAILSTKYLPTPSPAFWDMTMQFSSAELPRHTLGFSNGDLLSYYEQLSRVDASRVLN